jgi:uncharacterized protein (TIGR02271 family)
MADDQAAPERITLQVHEERLEARTREIETGRIRVTKRVELHPVELHVDAARDEVTIQRVPVDQEVESAPAPRQEGDTLILPVVEEIVVTETRLVVREEIRITRRRITDSIPIQDTVRRESIEIERVEPGPDEARP